MRRDGDGVVWAVYVDSPEFGDADVKILRQADGLESLRMPGTRISDVALCDIGAIETLEELDISNTAVTDAGIAHLSGLTNLQTLEVRGCRELTITGILALAALPHLRSLHVGGTTIQPGDLAELIAAHPQCTLRADDLTIDAVPGLAAGCRVSAGGGPNFPWHATIVFSDGPLTVELLRRVPSPEMVDVISADESCAVTEDAIAVLNRFPQLQKLILARASIDDEACAPLFEHPRLRCVTFRHSQLTDAGLAGFADMRSLQYLYVGSDLISGRALDALAQLHLKSLGIESKNLEPDCLNALTHYQELQYLSLANCGLSDESLGQLPRLPLVRSLNISGNSVSDAGLSALDDWPQLQYVTAHDTDVTEDALLRFRERE